MIISVWDLLKWGAALTLLIIFYLKVIKPFMQTMIELPTEDLPTEDLSQLRFDDDDAEQKEDLDKARRDKLRRQLAMGEDAYLEDQVRLDLLREKLQKITSDEPESSSKLLEQLTRGREEER